jgi:hypothetical protein
MNGRKYPVSLFVIGFLGNVVFRLFWLFVPAVILMIVGSAVKVCLYIGLLLLLIDLVISFAEMLVIRKTMLSDSENPDFKDFQDSFFADGDWKKNVKDYVEEKIATDQNLSSDKE